MHPLLNIAVGAARRAGEVIVRSLDRVGALVVSEKGRNDFVSEVDRAAEQAVIAAIRKAYPSHGFLAEESGAQAGDDYTGRIRAAALEVPGVLGIEQLRVRKSGLEYFADIHVEVDPAMTVAEGHAIGHAVKDRLVDGFPTLRDVLVHLEPHERPTAS